MMSVSAHVKGRPHWVGPSLPDTLCRGDIVALDQVREGEGEREGSCGEFLSTRDGGFRSKEQMCGCVERKDGQQGDCYWQGWWEQHREEVVGASLSGPKARELEGVMWGPGFFVSLFVGLFLW